MKEWQPIDTMKTGYTGEGLLSDGRVVDIYRVSEVMTLDATTGAEIEVTSWRFHTARLLLLTL